MASHGDLHHNGDNRNLWKHSRLPCDSQVVRLYLNFLVERFLSAMGVKLSFKLLLQQFVSFGCFVLSLPILRLAFQEHLDENVDQLFPVQSRGGRYCHSSNG